jgi:2-dehydropantoate 2-reductase
VKIVAMVLGFTFRSEFGNIFMYQHSMKAPDEMHRVHEQFYTDIKGYRSFQEDTPSDSRKTYVVQIEK